MSVQSFHNYCFLAKMSVCHVCGVSAANFSRKCLFEDHIKSHIGQTFVCPSCGKSFSQYYSFLKHQSMFHSTITYACEECGKQFTNNINLKRHEQIHLKSSDHICDIYSSIHNPEERYYLMLKSIKNLDKCDFSIFVPRK